MINAEERALKFSKDAIDREFLAGSPEGPAILFEIYCLHTSSRYPAAACLKYFLRLTAKGGAYAQSLVISDVRISSRSSFAARCQFGRFSREKCLPEASDNGPNSRI